MVLGQLPEADTKMIHATTNRGTLPDAAPEFPDLMITQLMRISSFTSQWSVKYALSA